MSRLEEKLKELGYKPYYQSAYYDSFVKRVENIGNYNIILDLETKKITMSYLVPNAIHNREQLDNLQQAFNVMQKDLEILKECEE